MSQDIWSKYIVPTNLRLKWKTVCVCVFVCAKPTNSTRAASWCLGLFLLPCYKNLHGRWGYLCTKKSEMLILISGIIKASLLQNNMIKRSIISNATEVSRSLEGSYLCALIHACNYRYAFPYPIQMLSPEAFLPLTLGERKKTTKKGNQFSLKNKLYNSFWSTA